MEAIAFSLILILLAILIGSILGFVAFSKVSSLANKIHQLRSKIDQLSSELNKLREGTNFSDLGFGDTTELSSSTIVQNQTRNEKSSQVDTTTPTEDKNDQPTSLQQEPVKSKVTSTNEKGTFFESVDPSEKADELKELKSDILSAGYSAKQSSTTASERITQQDTILNKIYAFFESIKTNWMAWLGGTCIAIAGIFFAKYSIEQGLLGPTARILLGIMTGIGLHFAAYRLYKKSGSHISLATMAGGGSITLFATLLAALHFYQMFSPLVVFLLLAVVAVATMWFAILHGPALAIIGMLGAYIVPILVSSGSGNLIAAMLYALIITTSVLLLVKTVKIDWLWWGAVIGGLAWWILSMSSEQPDGFRGIYLGILAYLLFAITNSNYGLTKVGPNDLWPRHFKKEDLKNYEFKRPWITQLPLVILLLVGAQLVSILKVDWFNYWLSFMVLPTLLLFVSGYQQRLTGLVWLLHIGTLAAIVLSHQTELSILNGVEYTSTISSNSLIFSFSALALIFIGLAIKNYRVGVHSAWWSAIIAVTPILLMLSVYILIGSIEDTSSWALGVILIGVINMGIARQFLKIETHRWLTIWHLLAGNFAYAIAVYITFENTTLTLALAAQIFSIAWLIKRFSVIEIAWLLKTIIAIVIMRLTLNPFLLDYPTLFHWPVWTYGAATIICYLSSLQVKSHSSLKQWTQIATLHLFTLTAWTELRYILNDGNVFQEDYSFIEAILYVGLFGALSIIYYLRAKLSDSIAQWYKAYSYLLITGALINFSVILTSLLESDSWALDNISDTPIVNLLTLALGVPLVIAYLFSRYHESRFHKSSNIMIGVSGFLFVSFQIRHLWQGTPSLQVSTSDAELYTYSIVWLVMAVGAMIIGGWRVSQNIYKAGLILLAIVIGKIFLVDMAGLGGLLRVASFMGLGLALVGISFLHQKLKPKAQQKVQNE